MNTDKPIEEKKDKDKPQKPPRSNNPLIKYDHKGNAYSIGIKDTQENNNTDNSDLLMIEIKTLITPSSKAHFDIMNFLDGHEIKYTSTPIPPNSLVQHWRDEDKSLIEYNERFKEDEEGFTTRELFEIIKEMNDVEGKTDEFCAGYNHCKKAILSLFHPQSDSPSKPYIYDYDESSVGASSPPFNKNKKL